MSHYFIEDDSLQTDIKHFEYCFQNQTFHFISNSGVFSPGHVDPASDLLIRTVPALRGTFLDLGCGYGVIGVVLSKVYGLTLTMADVNGRALTCAEENCRANGVSAQILKSDCFEQIDGFFENIALNPPIHAGKAVMYRMYEGSFTHLQVGGKLFIVIQEKHGAKSSVKKLMELFGNCAVLYKKKGYYILQATRS